jgi:WhiB family transcriptional regulator, redox-sensing transcriptional regulator
MTAMWSPVFDWDNNGWRDQAACRHTDPNLFFPAGTTGLAIENIEAAKEVCRSCPVQDACLRFAFETNQEAGIWGGTDEDERRRLRRSWRAGRQARTRSATT